MEDPQVVRTRGDRRPRGSLALILVLVLSGCASGPAPVTTLPAAPSATATPVASPPPTVPATPHITPTPFPADDAFAQLVRTVSGGLHPEGSQLELFWRGIIAGANVDGQRPYQAPLRLVGYRGGDIPEVACADGTDSHFWRQNAYYCRSERTIAFDETWLRDLYARLGPGAAMGILAHEWGHNVQDIIGNQDYSIRNELQADCFAGMFILSREPADLPPDQRVDETVALAAFFEIGNRSYDASSWFQAAEHGSPQQRILAYIAGVLPMDQALPWCFGYRDFVPRDRTDVGPWRLLNLPGRTERWEGDVYQIDPESRTSYASSGIRLSWIDHLPLAGQGATIEQLTEVARIRFPGTKLLFGPQLIDANVPRGGGVFQYFERSGTTGGSASVESGALALISSSSKEGGLTIVVHRPQPAPVDPPDPAKLAILQEEVVTLFEVLTRLCGPDDSPSIGDPDLDPVCMDVQ